MVAAHSKEWIFACSMLWLQFRIPPVSQVSVSCEHHVLSVKCVCVGPITPPEESYWVRCAWLWSWSLDNEEAQGQKWLLRHKKLGCVEYIRTGMVQMDVSLSLCDHRQITELMHRVGLRWKFIELFIYWLTVNGLNGGKLQYCCSGRIDW